MIYPESEILSFRDAMLSVRYGFNHPVDMVYTNVILRHITGFQVMKLLRNVHPAIAVSFVTDTDQYVEMAAIQGANGYYLTPTSKEGLLANNLLIQRSKRGG